MVNSLIIMGPSRRSRRWTTNDALQLHYITRFLYKFQSNGCTVQSTCVYRHAHSHSLPEGDGSILVLSLKESSSHRQIGIYRGQRDTRRRRGVPRTHSVNIAFTTVSLWGHEALPLRCYTALCQRLRGNRMVNASALRLEMLDRIHTGHQGVVRCEGRDRQPIWWP